MHGHQQILPPRSLVTIFDSGMCEVHLAAINPPTQQDPAVQALNAKDMRLALLTCNKRPGTSGDGSSGGALQVGGGGEGAGIGENGESRLGAGAGSGANTGTSEPGDTGSSDTPDGGGSGLGGESSGLGGGKGLGGKSSGLGGGTGVGGVGGGTKQLSGVVLPTVMMLVTISRLESAGTASQFRSA